MEFIPHIIDGEETESVSGERFTSVDPWTREPYAEVALGGEDDADRAVQAARRAFDEGPWPRLGYAERGALLHRFADLIVANADALGLADTTDMGKPISESRGNDVPRAAANYRFFADHARLATAEVLPMDSGHHAYTRFSPAGVVAAIAPWNFPLMLESWKVAPALAWGNTVVLKPAEDTPASATIMARLALEAGLPPGVFNVLHGYGPGSAGAALTEHPGVDRITFTGESGTGKVIARAASANLVPVSLELGGKGANIVFDDAELGNAVDWSIRAIFTNAGQVCLAGSGCTSSAASTPSSSTGSRPRRRPWWSVTRRTQPPDSARWPPRSTTRRSGPTWTASSLTAARSAPAASATAGPYCPPWWKTPRPPPGCTARRCSARW